MGTQLHAKAALEFVQRRGIVLASAKGDVPRLIDAILGESISGNWWAHPRGSFIYNVLAEVSESEDVLVCRLLRGKITLIHRRLWPALVRAANHFEPAQLAKVREQHTASGRHVTREIAFPLWVPRAVQEQAAVLSEADALASPWTSGSCTQSPLDSTGAYSKTPARRMTPNPAFDRTRRSALFFPGARRWRRAGQL